MSSEDWDSTLRYIDKNLPQNGVLIFYPNYFSTPYRYYSKKLNIYRIIISKSYEEQQKISQGYIKYKKRHCLVFNSMDPTVSKYQEVLSHDLNYSKINFSGINLYCLL